LGNLINPIPTPDILQPSNQAQQLGNVFGNVAAGLALGAVGDAALPGTAAEGSVADMAAQAEAANAKLANEQALVGDQPYVAPTQSELAPFQTHGITVNDVPQSIQNQMLSDLQAGGISNANDVMTQIIQSGDTVPVPMQASQDTTLYKLVDTTGRFNAPSSTTVYWIDQTQLDSIQANPSLANDILGFPGNTQASSFTVFEIQPKPGTTPVIYQSQVATTTNASGLTNVGNAIQTIVPNRSLWTTPQPAGITIQVKP
jgi:hypothetical protein